MKPLRNEIPCSGDTADIFDRPCNA